MILDIFKIPIYAKKLTLDYSYIEKYCLEKKLTIKAVLQYKKRRFGYYFG